MRFQVDDGVIRELFPALHRNDWDVLIGHFLGVVLSYLPGMMPNYPQSLHKLHTFSRHSFRYSCYFQSL